jgi:hypothetical protein
MTTSTTPPKRVRPWLKLRLGAGVDALKAAEIVSKWRRAGKAALFVTTAIRLYAQLMDGDTELLESEFPFLKMILGSHYQPMHRVFEREQSAEFEEIIIERPEDELLKNFFDGLGI